jgi:superfamily I DNA/RNA helicase
MNKNTIQWTEEQLNIIRQSSNTRMIVDAGPGTGKTATLSARIAWLIDSENIEPNSIWVISFTRTAVKELRNRIGDYINDQSKVFAIKTATLDAYAWSIQSGFNLDAKLSGSFNSNINEATNLIKENNGVFEYISTASHLFIDESQDIVTNRVELTLELINALSEKSGITIFSDEAQAIYDWQESQSSTKGNLPSNIKIYFNNFKYFELKKIHRTNNEKLIKIFEEGRDILRSNKNEKIKFGEIKKIIFLENDYKKTLFNDDLKKINLHDPNTFLLFRSRGDVFKAASEFKNFPFRLRVSGMPHAIHSYIGIIFWDFSERIITKEKFMDLWAERITSNSRFNRDAAWVHLINNFGKSSGSVDIQLMNRRLSGLSPPIDFCDPEYGFEGPIIGTIHASKGREADKVYLYFNFTDDPVLKRYYTNFSEAKVMYVGATRAKKELIVGRGHIVSSKTGGGRAYTEDLMYQSLINVEIGKSDDITPDGLVGKKLFHNHSNALSAQKFLQHNSEKFLEGNIVLRNTDPKFYDPPITYSESPEIILGYLGEEFKRSMKFLTYQFKCRYYRSVTTGIKILGARTVAVSENDRLRSELLEPWQTSGFMLAPMVVGYTKTKFSFNPAR